ncbi:MAG TPA: hypothetical protein VJH23_03590 [archaeon]|nr:hypothetical protein [archaeon]
MKPVRVKPPLTKNKRDRLLGEDRRLKRQAMKLHEEEAGILRPDRAFSVSEVRAKLSGADNKEFERLAGKIGEGNAALLVGNVMRGSKFIDWPRVWKSAERFDGKISAPRKNRGLDALQGV